MGSCLMDRVSVSQEKRVLEMDRCQRWPHNIMNVLNTTQKSKGLRRENSGWEWDGIRRRPRLLKGKGYTLFFFFGSTLNSYCIHCIVILYTLHIF